MNNFVPLNQLETALVKAKSSEVSMPDFLKIFLKEKLAVPSGAQVMADGAGFQPLLFTKEGMQMVACFTAKDRSIEFADVAPYCLEIKGAEFLKIIPAGFGVVINPGIAVGFDISPVGLQKILKDFA